MKYLAFVLFMCCVFSIPERAYSNDDDALTKSQAAKLLNYSQQEWNKRVRESARDETAKAKESGEGTLTLYIFGDEKISGVMPIYAEDDPHAPFALHVSTSYHPKHPLTTMLKKDSDMAGGICKKWITQMGPEFTVSCKYEKIAEGIMFNFLIAQTGSPHANWVKQLWKK